MQPLCEVAFAGSAKAVQVTKGIDVEFAIQYRPPDSNPIWPAVKVPCDWTVFRTYEMESEMLEDYPRVRQGMQPEYQLRMMRLEHLQEYERMEARYAPSH